MEVIKIFAYCYFAVEGFATIVFLILLWKFLTFKRRK